MPWYFAATAIMACTILASRWARDALDDRRSTCERVMSAIGIPGLIFTIHAVWGAIQ